jgi:hypothetical protein
MKVNFWDCKYSDYDESYCEETGESYGNYMCTHPAGDACCDLNNKYANSEEDCKLIDKESK